MALKEMPKVGDEVRYIGGDNGELTEELLYEVIYVDDDGDAKILDDNGDDWYLLEYDNFDYYELVVEDTPVIPCDYCGTELGEIALGGRGGRMYCSNICANDDDEPQPDVTDLIANLGRRLHEVETGLAPREYETIEVTDISATYPKYFKDVSGIASIDVYKTHELFGIDDPSGAIQHASKKLLLSGARTGGKSKFTDIKEARDTLNRWLEIHAMEAEASE